MLDPKTFPRPPALEKVAAHLLVKWPGSSGGTIAETRNSYRVLETYHPPTYYIPRSDCKVDLTPTNRASFCEWKGRAKYFSIETPNENGEVPDRIWTYENPTGRFKDLAGFLSFYTGPWECYVDGEQGMPISLLHSNTFAVHCRLTIFSSGASTG